METKIQLTEKKKKISIAIDSSNYGKLEEIRINKSQLINWLLQEYLKKERGQ